MPNLSVTERVAMQAAAIFYHQPLDLDRAFWEDTTEAPLWWQQLPEKEKETWMILVSILSHVFQEPAVAGGIEKEMGRG